MIEAVTFDFWNTIAREPPGTMSTARRRAVEAACAEGGVELDEGRLEAALEEVADSRHRSWTRGEHVHPRQGAASLTAALGLEGAVAEAVAAAFVGAGEGVELELAPGVAECLEELAGRGLRLGIVCDVGFTGGELLRGFLARRGLLEHFSGWAFSDEVGHYKPAAPIFAAALAALDAAPAAAAHVGDLRRTDVAGAAAAGMTAIRYRGVFDDAAAAGQPEAEFVLDSHAELPPLLAQLG